MTVSDWLARNSAAFQSIAAACNVALALITIVVLVVTWKAIMRQAKAAEDQTEAARALTQVAKDQTKAATDAAESARKQSDLLSAQIEQSTAPLLVAEPDEREGMRNCKLVNRGTGVAFQILYWQGDRDATKDNTRYKGVDREERWTVVYRDAFKDQQHWARKAGQVFSLT
jgi:hypothetical protein